MKKKVGFKLREICGEKLLVPEGETNIDFSNMISMNESAALLWDAIDEGEFTEDKLVDILLNEYEVDESTVRADVKNLVQQWLEAKIIDE